VFSKIVSILPKFIKSSNDDLKKYTDLDFGLRLVV